MSFVDTFLCDITLKLKIDKKNDPINALNKYKGFLSFKEREVLKNHLDTTLFQKWDTFEVVPILDWQIDQKYLLFLDDLYRDLDLVENTYSWRFQELIKVVRNQIKNFI